jgi:hypothetical protein
MYWRPDCCQKSQSLRSSYIFARYFSKFDHNALIVRSTSPNGLYYAKRITLITPSYMVSARARANTIQSRATMSQEGFEGAIYKAFSLRGHLGPVICHAGECLRHHLSTEGWRSRRREFPLCSRSDSRARSSGTCDCRRLCIVSPSR